MRCDGQVSRTRTLPSSRSSAQRSWRWFAKTTTLPAGEQTISVTRPISPLETSRISLEASAGRIAICSYPPASVTETSCSPSWSHCVKPSARAAARSVANRRSVEERHRKLLSARVECDLRSVGVQNEVLERVRRLLETPHGLRHRRVRFNRNVARGVARDVVASDLRAGGVHDARAVGRGKAYVVLALIGMAQDVRFRRAGRNRGSRCPRGRPGSKCALRSTSASTGFRRAAAIE